jgi:hypothetical protein
MQRILQNPGFQEVYTQTQGEILHLLQEPSVTFAIQQRAAYINDEASDLIIDYLYDVIMNTPPAQWNQGAIVNIDQAVKITQGIYVDATAEEIGAE